MSGLLCHDAALVAAAAGTNVQRGRRLAGLLAAGVVGTGVGTCGTGALFLHVSTACRTTMQLAAQTGTPPAVRDPALCALSRNYPFQGSTGDKELVPTPQTYYFFKARASFSPWRRRLRALWACTPAPVAAPAVGCRLKVVPSSSS